MQLENPMAFGADAGASEFWGERRKVESPCFDCGEEREDLDYGKCIECTHISALTALEAERMKYLGQSNWAMVEAMNYAIRGLDK